ncbi:hypothetical protein [Candidatus Uabimicrobium amorphum]|uniref:Uncharacterized protein n=1 Tax=Uabimicrobium amorphum TaxID=2596890 RepID=A0A5S9IQY2_UABAM|nr:hypothetical protein [Candidatus Uabimicrobium amorphum]BBM86483.1 hypothetical protein UABAM_04869 [Candidatus Uabimicrobium amorphum]
MTKIKNILFLLLFISFGFAEINLFRVKNIKLYTENYPWLDELHLQVDGAARKGLNNTLITISIYHETQRVRWYDVLVKNVDGRLVFGGKWGPINNGVEEIQAGVYTVKVEVSLEKQSRKMFQLLTTKLRGQKIKAFEKKFPIGSAARRKREKKQNQQYYLEKIKTIQNIYEEMITNRNSVFRHIIKAKEKKMTIKQWRSWFNNSFNTRLTQLKQSLEKREKQFFSLRYKTTHDNIKLYCKFLKEMTVNYTKSFYEYYRKKSRYRPPYTNRQFTTHLRYIRQLHVESQKDMQIDLESKLGFMPPRTPY